LDPGRIQPKTWFGFAVGLKKIQRDVLDGFDQVWTRGGDAQRAVEILQRLFRDRHEGKKADVIPASNESEAPHGSPTASRRLWRKLLGAHFPFALFITIPPVSKLAKSGKYGSINLAIFRLAECKYL
jgi:hypothetical protein